ncbi:MAG: hypothetical protein J6Z49_11965 [Kiritimatiellae bacterium]|nr:hypothetical protein [Kiritimatiellia bacterium]
MMFVEEGTANEEAVTAPLYGGRGAYGDNLFVATDRDAIDLDELVKDEKFIRAAKEFYGDDANMEDFNPRDIVDSAGIFDDPDFIQKLYDDGVWVEKPIAIKTNNGLVVMGDAKSTKGYVKSLDPVTYDDTGNVIPLSQRFDRMRDDIRFDTSELAAEAHSRAALADIADGKPYGVLHNPKYGEIRYPLGRAGKGGEGFLHIVEHRMNGGSSLNDAISVAIKVGEAAESGTLGALSRPQRAPATAIDMAKPLSLKERWGVNLHDYRNPLKWLRDEMAERGAAFGGETDFYEAARLQKVFDQAAVNDAERRLREYTGMLKELGVKHEEAVEFMQVQAAKGRNAAPRHRQRQSRTHRENPLSPTQTALRLSQETRHDSRIKKRILANRYRPETASFQPKFAKMRRNIADFI